MMVERGSNRSHESMNVDKYILLRMKQYSEYILDLHHFATLKYDNLLKTPQESNHFILYRMKAITLYTMTRK